MKIYVESDRMLTGDPEVVAMLQAFYSRSPMPIQERLANLLSNENSTKRAEKIRAALNNYYIGYGHASIGDCGSATIFIEDVSMLAAKAIQAHPLYNGQEVSTRYVDFSKQNMVVPMGQKEGDSSSTSDYDQISQFQEKFRALYIEALPHLIEYARKLYTPEWVLSTEVLIGPQEDMLKAHEKTIRAIAFDYARGILPCGSATSLSVTMTLRQLREHFRQLLTHELVEVQKVAQVVLQQLAKVFPDSFKVTDFESPLTLRTRTADNWRGIQPFSMMETANGRFPEQIRYSLETTLDFASWRDLQRHRNGFQTAVHVQPRFEPERYYTDALQQACPEVFERFMHTYQDVGVCSTIDPLSKQYCLPMATPVQFMVDWNLPQWEYVIALRTKTTVHPTLRNLMHKANKFLKENCPMYESRATYSLMYQHSDRGNQDIVHKADNQSIGA
jgi:thymidylate synthase ThyX